MSGRPRTIDRDKILDAAEAVVTSHGAGGLSFDAVAKAAGVTKSGVQYCFGTKDSLIRAIISRWNDSFDQAVRARTGPDLSARATIRAHLAATRDWNEAEQSRTAVMMSLLLQSPDQLAASRLWYRQRLSKLDFSDATDRMAALAFMAGEGAFLLRAYGLLDIEKSEWTTLFGDALELMRDAK